MKTSKWALFVSAVIILFGMLAAVPNVLTPEQHADVERVQTEAAVLRRVSQPAEVAVLALFITDKAPAMTGQVVAMDNGLHLNAG